MIKATTDIPDTYVVGDLVPQDGLYVCVPCGEKQYLKRGDTFVPCTACLSDREKQGASKGLWEKLSNDKL